MPTTSTPRPETAKKNVPIKWRDNTWRKLIIIRRVAGRTSAHGQCEPRLFDWVALPRLVVWSRAGRRLPGGARSVSTWAMPQISRWRLSNSWRSNNPL